MALDALRGQHTLSESQAKHEIHPALATKWKLLPVEGLVEVSPVLGGEEFVAGGLQSPKSRPKDGGWSTPKTAGPGLAERRLLEITGPSPYYPPEGGVA